VRADVLLELKRGPQVSARELAAKLGVSLNAVRHHLKELEAEKLVQHERQHRGVGAPLFAIPLSPAGDALFPRGYEATLLQCLDHVVRHEGRDAAVRLLESHFAELNQKLEPRNRGMPAKQRLEVVARAMTAEGYMARSGVLDDSYATLTEHNCAIHAVAERFSRALCG